MCFIPDMKNPADRRACVEGIIWWMLTCTILLAYVHTLVCPASWEVRSFIFIFIFILNPMLLFGIYPRS